MGRECNVQVMDSFTVFLASRSVVGQIGVLFQLNPVLESALGKHDSFGKNDLAVEFLEVNFQPIWRS